MPVLPPWVSDPAGPVARTIVPLYWFMFALAVIVLVIVDGGLIWAGIKFRERPGVQAKQFHSHNLLELVWTVIPTLMVVTFAVLSFQRLLIINDVDSGAQMTIQVHARQWAFTFEYPKEQMFQLRDGSPLQVVQELNIPVDTKVKLEITSQDVIHSFWVPNLGGKKDAVPGRTTTLWLEGDRVGEFKGQCFEFCGDGHADMLINVIVHPKEQYAAWAAGAVKAADSINDPATKEGRELFLSLPCASCHTVAGTTAAGKVGPELTNIAGQGPNKKIAGVLGPVNAENLHRWIKDPQKEKPGTQMPTLGLDDATVDKIVAWLLTLKTQK